MCFERTTSKADLEWGSLHMDLTVQQWVAAQRESGTVPSDPLVALQIAESSHFSSLGPFLWVSYACVSSTLLLSVIVRVQSCIDLELPC